MKLFTRVLLTGICVSLLTISAMGKGPKPSYEVGKITGDIVSVILDVDDKGVITVITDGADGAEITMGVGVRGWTEVELWLSANILAIDYGLLENHVIGTDPLWPSGDDPPLWIEGEFEPSKYLLPEDTEDTDLGWGRYYFGEARLIKGEDDSRFDFDFSPHGPCTPRPWGTTLPVDDDPAIWAEWRLSDDEDSPPVCPFALVLLGGLENIPDSGDVTFEATSELFLVRKGGYPRVLLYDFTLGPLCPEEGVVGCIKETGGYTVGTGPVENSILFDFSEN